MSGGKPMWSVSQMRQQEASKSQKGLVYYTCDKRGMCLAHSRKLALQICCYLIRHVIWGTSLVANSDSNCRGYSMLGDHVPRNMHGFLKMQATGSY